MITVLRDAGLRVIIYTDDHEPAHVHVLGDGEAKLDLLPEVRVEWTRGMTRSEARKAIRLVRENQILLLNRWNEIHG